MLLRKDARVFIQTVVLNYFKALEFIHSISNPHGTHLSTQMAVQMVPVTRLCCPSYVFEMWQKRGRPDIFEMLERGDWSVIRRNHKYHLAPFDTKASCSRGETKESGADRPPRQRPHSLTSSPQHLSSAKCRTRARTLSRLGLVTARCWSQRAPVPRLAAGAAPV